MSCPIKNPFFIQSQLSIGVARIFSEVHFFLKKLTTFLVVVLNTQAETPKVTTPTL